MDCKHLIGKKDHPEDYCHRCGGRNISWHTENKLWNSLIRDAGHPKILCPICFDEIYKEKYGLSPHWVFIKE